MRVARQAALTGARVVVATDDARIEAAVRSAGFEAVQTPPDCASGTDRVAAAVTLLGLGGARLILNVQGDEPLIDPEDLVIAKVLAGRPKEVEDASRMPCSGARPLVTM